MQTLRDVKPTPEQLTIVSRNKPGIEVIRGAAGSGKTTTALLRLRSLIGMFTSQRKRQQSGEPVKILVLTYNRTLRGYIEVLARQQVAETAGIDLKILTFAKWAMSALRNPTMIESHTQRQKILELGVGVKLENDFLLSEIEYVMGRFLPENIDDYISARRDGRGATPRIGKSMREAILNDVIKPYQEWIDLEKIWDWNDLAVKLANEKLEISYDIIIADEAQDFSANQIRAIHNQMAKVSSLTFVLDSAQRIYARGYTWSEAGVTIRPENSKRLKKNYRNTVEIAKFAASLIDGVPIDDDATMPDFESCDRHGPKPLALKGRFSNQMKYIVQYINNNVDLSSQSVAILHPLGGGWFSYVKQTLNDENLQYIEISRQSDWPVGSENIALSTLHSAKGLEFDHVIIISLDTETLPHGEDADDDRLLMLRRLVAMGAGRARESLLIGYKSEGASNLLNLIDTSTYDEVAV
ncbi:MAG: 3'-5' exonuclease [Pseudomonadota bacterium]